MKFRFFQKYVFLRVTSLLIIGTNKTVQIYLFLIGFSINKNKLL